MTHSPPSRSLITAIIAVLMIDYTVREVLAVTLWRVVTSDQCCSIQARRWLMLDNLDLRSATACDREQLLIGQRCDGDVVIVPHRAPRHNDRSSARAPSFCDQLLQSIEVTFVTFDLIWSQRCAIPFLQMQSMHMNAPATREFSESMFWRLKVQNSKRFKYHCFSRSIALRFAAGKQMGRFQLPNEAAREVRPARSGTSGAACLMQCRCLFFGSSRNRAIAPHH